MLSQVEIQEVARRLRRRHLHSLLQVLHETRDCIEAARRSRRRQARLLRLVRRHGLVQCLRKLKEPGITVGAGPHGHYFYFDSTCLRGYLLGLRGRYRELWIQFRELRRQNHDPMIASLRTLFEEVETITKNPLEVRWVLPDVQLEGVWIGDLEVRLNLERFRVRVFNLSADTEIRGGYQHPHVSSDGEICWNGHDLDAETFHRAGDFLALRDLIDNLLHTYNPSSPFIKLEDWENGLGEECYECGERRPEEDMAYAESIQGWLCPECRYYCEECDDYVHYEDFNVDWEMCEDCVDRATGVCSRCGDRVRSEDLTEIALNEAEDHLPLCEGCLKKNRKKEEENDESDNGASRVLASAVVVS